MALFAKTTRLRYLLAAAVLPLALAACTDNSAPAAAGPIKVSSTNDGCTLSSKTTKSGNLTFAIQNDGNQVTEFYLLAEDGLRIIAEVENIGPGLTRNLVVTAPAGKYTTACKPGMQGDGIRAAFEVTESGEKLGRCPPHRGRRCASRRRAAPRLPPWCAGRRKCRGRPSPP